MYVVVSVQALSGFTTTGSKALCSQGWSTCKGLAFSSRLPHTGILVIYSIQSFSVQLIVFHDILWSLFLLAVHLNWLCILVSLLGSKLNSILVGAPRGSMLLKQ